MLLNLKISEEFNEQIKQMILGINRKHKQIHGTFNKGLMTLLEMWYAKPKKAMDEYFKKTEEDEKQGRIEGE